MFGKKTNTSLLTVSILAGMILSSPAQADLWQDTKETAASVWELTKEGAGSAWEKTKALTEDAKESEAFENLKEGASSAADTVSDKETYVNAWGAVKDSAGSVKEKVEQIGSNE